MRKLLFIGLLLLNLTATAQICNTYTSEKVYYDITAIDKPANFQPYDLHGHEVEIIICTTNDKMNGIYRITIKNGYQDQFILSNCKSISDGWLKYDCIDNRGTYMLCKLKQDKIYNKLYIMLLYKNVTYCYEVNIDTI